MHGRTSIIRQNKHRIDEITELPRHHYLAVKRSHYLHITRNTLCVISADPT